MFDSDIILSVKHRLGNSEFKHAILTQNWETWPCGVPVVYAANSDLSDQENRTPVATLMAPGGYTSGVELSNTPNSIICPAEFKPIYGNHNVVTVDYFNIRKFDRLIEYIKDVGSISFVVDGKRGHLESLNSVAKLAKKFRYNIMFYFNMWRNSKYLDSEDDKYLCVITLYDLPYCVPIFNTRKVDGIGLSFAAAPMHSSVGYNTLNRTFRLDAIYSNYEDNILVVDGAQVNQPNPVSNDVYAELKKFLDAGLPIKKRKPGKEGYDLSRMQNRYGYGTAERYMSYGKDRAFISESEAAEMLKEVKSQQMPTPKAISPGEITEVEQGEEISWQTMDGDSGTIVVNEHQHHPEGEPPHFDWATSSTFSIPTMTDDSPDPVAEGPGSDEAINDQDLSDDEWLDSQDPEGN